MSAHTETVAAAMPSATLSRSIIVEAFMPQNRTRRYRKSILHVTDIADSEWCQRKVSFSLLPHLSKVVTRPMKRGKRRHQQLERRVARPLQLAASSREERFLRKLFKLCWDIQGLQRFGIAREVFVFGRLQGVWLAGAIDEVRLYWCKQCREFFLMLVEHKTRSRSRLPRSAHMAMNRLQVMLYWALLAQLQQGKASEQLTQLCLRKGHNPEARLSPMVRNKFQAELSMDVLSAQDIFNAVQTMIMQLPHCSQVLAVQYETQVSKARIGDDVFQYDDTFMNAKLSDHLHFWNGQEPPKSVQAQQGWKCVSCPYAKWCVTDAGKD